MKFIRKFIKNAYKQDISKYKGALFVFSQLRQRLIVHSTILISLSFYTEKSCEEMNNSVIPTITGRLSSDDSQLQKEDSNYVVYLHNTVTVITSVGPSPKSLNGVHR